MYTGKPTTGYRCIRNVQNELHQAKYPQCIWRCLRKKGCRYINHNSVTDECELGLSQCKALLAGAGFIVRAFGPLGNYCLQWVTSWGLEHVPVEVKNKYVPRITYIGTLLLGWFDKGGAKFMSYMEGQSVVIDEGDQAIEVLAKYESCALPWISYTAGDTLPDGAVAGGRLDDGSPTYVAKTTIAGDVALGYYDAETGYGYFWLHDAYKMTSIDILVLI